MANKSFKDIVSNRQQILEENNNKSTVPKAEPTLTEFDLIMGIKQDEKIDQEKTTPGKITAHENTQTITTAEPKKERKINAIKIGAKREIQVNVRLTKDEYNYLYQMASDYGYRTVSDYSYYLLTKEYKHSKHKN